MNEIPRGRGPAWVYDCAESAMTPRFRSPYFVEKHVRLAALALAAVVALAAPCARAAGDGEHPGPGEKIVRSTVGTAPQTLTGLEKEKLAASAAMAAPPAPISTLRPAPWLPPGWRAQFMNGGAAPPSASPGSGERPRARCRRTPCARHAERCQATRGSHHRVWPTRRVAGRDRLQAGCHLS